MNNLTKSIASLLILHPVIAFSTTTDNSLESYLKNYHPESYTAAQKTGVDINALEFSEPNINNIEKVALKKHLAERVNPRKYCEKSGGIFLENNFVATCVSKDGTFGNGSLPLGMTFNPSGTGTINAPDYLRPGTPFEYFSITFNNQLFTNNNKSGIDDIPTTSISRLNRHSPTQEGGVLVSSTINQQNSQLDITQKYTLDPNSREIIVRVEMKNTGYRTLKNVTYARGLDPDQDYQSINNGPFNTVNRIGHTYYNSALGQPIRVAPDNIAWASGKKGLSVALYSVDPVAHKTCISPTWTTNPIDILNHDCGLAQQPIHNPPIYTFDYSDSTINIAFKIGYLKPQETRVFSFKYLFNEEKPRIKPGLGPIPMPEPIKLPKFISIK